jgi:hypothetical protein
LDKQPVATPEKRPKPVVSVAAEQVLRQASSAERPEPAVPESQREQRTAIFTNDERHPEVPQAISAERVKAELLNKRAETLETRAPKGAETVRKTVEAAAEAAIPIESLYEKRHELKGNEDFAAAAEAAIKSKSSANNNGLNGNLPASSEQKMKVQSDQASTDRKSELYQQAVQGGVLVAGAFITAFLILYFLFLRS